MTPHLDAPGTLSPSLLQLPVFRSEWVLYLLLATSVLSGAVMLERWWFFRRRRFDVDEVRGPLGRRLERADYEGAAQLFGHSLALEAHVARVGLTQSSKGAGAVEDLMLGALGAEKQRYEKHLDVLATIASNAPYVGLFGTVLGIVRAFGDLASDVTEASSAVMAGMAEALVATALGLLVAIPALVAFNVFKFKVRRSLGNAQQLMRLVVAELKAGRAPAERAE